MTEIGWAEKVAGFLLADRPASRVAFLKSGATVYFSRRSPEIGASAHAPHSPVTDLIQGIYEQDPQMARRHVRNRIFTNAEPTPMCSGMVKVAARRLTAAIAPAAADDFSLDPAALVELPRFGRPLVASAIAVPSRVSSDREAMSLALALAACVPRDQGARYESDRPIGAVLVSDDGVVLSTAVNTNAHNRTLHAEVNLAQGFFAREKRPLPRRSRLFVSLKPCRMCAGMLWHLAEEPRELRVYFHELDPGPNARDTILDAGSFDRKQACASSPPSARELIALQLQEQLRV